MLLWAAQGSTELPAEAARYIGNIENELIFSIASIWEIVIKNSLGKSSFRVNPHTLRLRLIENGYSELPISGDHVLAVCNLPDLHKDPFDRILVAQASFEKITLLTSDSIIGSYPGPIILV